MVGSSRRRPRLALAPALLAAVLAGCSAAGDRPGADGIVDVVSGDTLRLGDGRVVRYAGVETPKAGTLHFAAALESNRQLAERGEVRLIVEAEAKGRITAHVYLRTLVYGEEKYVYLNAEQLLRGWGTFVDIEDARRPDLMASLRDMELRARASGRGVWAPQEKK